MKKKAPLDPLERLKLEHRELLDRLKDFSSAVGACIGSTSSEAVRKLTADLLRYFNSEFAIHIHNEEGLLFPAFEAAVGRDEKWLGESRVTHRDLGADIDEAVARVQTLTRDLEGKSAPAVASRLKELGETLDFILKRWGYHVEIEEKYLFPEMARKLSAETLERIGRQMDQTGRVAG